MQNKFVSPILERSFRRRYFQDSNSNSPISDNKTSYGSNSLSPINFMRNSRMENSFMSKFEKEVAFVCQENNKSIKTIEDKIDFFLTEANERIDYLKAHPPSPKAPFDYIPPKVRQLTPKKKTQAPPPSLPLQKLRLQSLPKKNRSIEDLLKTSENFSSKKKDELILQLQKSIGAIKTPCIEGLYAQISRNEHSFETYKNLRHNNEIDPFSTFNLVCSNEHVPPIPLLRHLQDSSLILNRYRMSETIATALSEAITLMPYLKKLHLDENFLSDAGGAALLKGLSMQEQLYSFFYTNNEIGQKFSKEFKVFVQKCPITELNFRGCKVPGHYLKEIIEGFRALKGLKKLYLSEIGFPDSCMEKFSKYIRRAQISELDLS